MFSNFFKKLAWKIAYKNAKNCLKKYRFFSRLFFFLGYFSGKVKYIPVVPFSYWGIGVRIGVHNWFFLSVWTKREQFLFKTQNWKISCTFFYILNFNFSQKPKNQILALNTFTPNNNIFRLVINWLTFVHTKNIKNI